MIRSIEGFHQDEQGDWIAELDCLHNQHVRHQPPFRDRAWVLTDPGRTSRIGGRLECPLCDRLELPSGLQLARTAGPFDADSLPAGLRRTHLVAAHTWGLLRVLEGALVFEVETAVPAVVPLAAGEQCAIPPGVPHALRIDGPVRLEVDFLVRGEGALPRS